MTIVNPWSSSELKKAQLEDPNVRTILEKKLNSRINHLGKKSLRDFKIATKTCIANNQDVCLPVSKMPHPFERSRINLVSYYKNIEDNFPVVCFTDASKINSKVGVAFVAFQDHIETEVHQFIIRDECNVFQA
ncbi:hypothetical protein AVEN_4196-1 [Araneus ventricosus]|uniref:Reverse transcriptase/retrotransposon-derived protein RNase H-like domain-containing protein n=1 Tax=Araneus ventricosus TaxID=182803 RepID=A0A4Y2F7U7_ARAVE|nr:hypothetical protein AVEN_4196-1 [Araneus ventricosus]